MSARLLNIFSKQALSFIFPITCAGCNELLPANDKLRLCGKCFSELKYISDGLFCQRCGKPLISGGAMCWNCKKEKYSFDFVRSALVYDEFTRELLHKYKYNGYEHLGRFFGWLMASAVQVYHELQDFDIIIPVPMHKFRKIMRGYNQSELAANAFAAFVKKKVTNKILSRHRFTRQQAKLKRDRRLLNVLDAFRVDNPDAVEGKNILLIDDVVTTCATIENCSRALKSAGAKKVYGLTIAHD